MGRASISIAITSNFNSRGIDAAIRKAEQLAVAYTHSKGQFGKAAVDMGASMGLASARLVSMGKAVADMGDKLTMGVTVPMGLAATAAVAAATKIDTAWYNVRKTVDMTEEGYQRLKDGAMALAEVQPVSADQILDIESLGGQLGIANDQLESFAKVVSGLDIATNMDCNTAAIQLAQFRNIVQMSEDDLDNMGSAIVDLGNHTATTEADIMNLALRFASAGHVAGMSNQEILGISAALSSLGMKAEAGGSALSRVINDISVAVDTNGEHLQAWADLAGQSVEDFSKSWKEDAAGTFELVLKGIAESGDEMNAALEEAGVTQIRTSDAMRRLASSGDLVSETVERANRAWAENTALTKEVDNRNESLQARWDTLVNRFTNDLARVGKPIAEIGLDVIEGLEPAIQGVGDMAQAFASASPDVQRFAFNLAGVAMAAGPVLSVGGRMMQVFGKVGQAVGRVYQQYGTYQEALKTTDVAMARNLSEQKSFTTQLGLSRNEWIKSAGGVDAWKRQVQAATTVISDNATQTVRNRAAVERYAQALGVGGESATKFSGGVRSSAEAVQFATGVNQRYKSALANGAKSATEAAQIALQYGDNTADAAVAANQAANEALGYGKALKSEAKNGTDAAKAALKAANNNKTKKAATKAAEAAVQSMSKADMEAALASEKGAAAMAAQGKAAEGASIGFGKFGNALKGALMGFGAMAAAGVAIAGITWIATQIQLAADRAEKLKLATDGLRDSLTRTSGAAEEQSRVWGSSVAAVDAAIEKQAQLGQVFEQNNTAAQTSIHTLDRAAETIQRYANQSGLSAGEMYQLKSAIDTVNEACGTQYQVLEDGTVALEGETGMVQQSTDAILENIEARKKQIQLQAIESNYQAAYEQELTTKKALRDAQLEYNDAMERYNSYLDSSGRLRDNLTEAEKRDLANLEANLGTIGSRLRDAREAAKAAGESTAFWDEQLRKVQEAAEMVAGSHEQLLAANLDYSTAFEGIEDATRNLDAFAARTMDLGITVESLGNLGYDAALKLAQGFDGSARSIVDTMKGIEGAEGILTNIGNNWKSSFSDATQSIIDSVSRVKGYTLAELSAMASDFGVKGDEATSAFMQALERGIQPERAAELARRLDEAFGENLTPERAAQAIQAYLDAMRDKLGDTGAIEAAIQSLKSTLGMVSFTEEGNRAASTFFADMRAPLEEGFAGLGEVVSERGLVIGQDSGLKMTEGWNQGVANGQGNVDASAQGLIGSLVQSLMGGIPQAESAGQQTGSGYGNAVSGQGSVAETAAINTLGRLLQIWLLGIASAQQAGLKTGQAYGQGVQSSAALGVSAVQATMQTILSIMNAAIGPATTAGQQTGAGYGLQLSARMLVAQQLTATAVNAIVRAMASGVSPAMAAGLLTGAGYATQLRDQASKAIGYATSISIKTGAAFGSGRGAAEAAGSALGNAFANAVSRSASRAVSIASSVRSQVASIFNSIPTANVKVNVQRTYSGPSSFGGHPVQYAALEPQTPAFRIAGYAAADRAATVAERTVQRISGVRVAQTSTAAQAKGAVMQVASSGPAPIDYDAMYRVVKSGVAAAIKESGGLAPDIRLDGKSIVDHVDRELGRRQQMWG